jgi:hypothetical protein
MCFSVRVNFSICVYPPLHLHCNNVDYLREVRIQQHDPDTWHLLIKYPELHFKAVLFHTGNLWSSIAHATRLKKSYYSIHFLVKHMQYE